MDADKKPRGYISPAPHEKLRAFTGLQMTDAPTAFSVLEQEHGGWFNRVRNPPADENDAARDYACGDDRNRVARRRGNQTLPGRVSSIASDGEQHGRDAETETGAAAVRYDEKITARARPRRLWNERTRNFVAKCAFVG